MSVMGNRLMGTIFRGTTIKLTVTRAIITTATVLARQARMRFPQATPPLRIGPCWPILPPGPRPRPRTFRTHRLPWPMPA
ncbi:MAG: hypothetical protein V4517_13640 [Pseudomonadota bacterium]